MDLSQLLKLSEKHPIIFYDGVCNLCNGFVQMVLRNDSEGKIHFCTLQEDAGKTIREHIGDTGPISTVIGIHEGKIYSHSDVLNMISNQLGGIWLLVKPFYLIPKGLRDFVYNWIANNRYNWFGQADSCILPDESVRSRFVC